MPLRAGAADKYGGRYEGLWTISCLADVMGERADAIRLEPPGEEGEGVEFWILKNGVREYHQVKRQRGRGERWTISSLGTAPRVGKESVLSNFAKKLTAPTAHCVRAIRAVPVTPIRTSIRQSLRRFSENRDKRNSISMRHCDTLCTSLNYTPVHPGDF